MAGLSARLTSAISHWPASIAIAANEIMLMLEAPPWSQTPPTRGVSRIDSASFWPYIISNFEVGVFTKSASTASFSTPASASALRHASMFIEIVLRPGSLPNAVWPIPAITYLPLIGSPPSPSSCR